MSLASFYAPWKHQKTISFLMFSVGVEGDQGVWNGLQEQSPNVSFSVTKNHLFEGSDHL